HTAAQAQHELAGVLPRIADAYPRLHSGVSTRQWLADARPLPAVTALREALTADIAATLWVLLAAAALVWLVAFANASQLFLLRAHARRPEYALRASLGARDRHLLAETLREALLLGGAAALLAAPACIAALHLLKA